MQSAKAMTWKRCPITRLVPLNVIHLAQNEFSWTSAHLFSVIFHSMMAMSRSSAENRTTAKHNPEKNKPYLALIKSALWDHVLLRLGVNQGSSCTIESRSVTNQVLKLAWLLVYLVHLHLNRLTNPHLTFTRPLVFSFVETVRKRMTQKNGVLQ